MKRQQFNQAIEDGMPLGRADDNPEVRGWVSSTFGRHFAGVEIEPEEGELPCQCPYCGSTESIARRRLNTAYADDTNNWLVSCRECFDNTVYGYNEMWADYYSGLL